MRTACKFIEKEESVLIKFRIDDKISYQEFPFTNYFYVSEDEFDQVSYIILPRAKELKTVIDKNGNYLLDEVENGLINANKFEIDSSEINLGNLENTMKLLKENHLDSFSDLLEILNTIFTFLPVIDAISGGAYTATILPQWITSYTNILATMNNAKTQELNGS
jgi:hypothetical protein